MKTVMWNMELVATAGAIAKEYVDESVDIILVTPEDDHILLLDKKLHWRTCHALLLTNSLVV